MHSQHLLQTLGPSPLAVVAFGGCRLFGSVGAVGQGWKKRWPRAWEAAGHIIIQQKNIHDERRESKNGCKVASSQRFAKLFATPQTKPISSITERRAKILVSAALRAESRSLGN